MRTQIIIPQHPVTGKIDTTIKSCNRCQGGKKCGHLEEKKLILKEHEKKLALEEKLKKKNKLKK